MALAAVSLVLNGGMAGVFLAFSVSVMPGLDDVDRREAVRAMASINRRIQNAVFFLFFFGAPVVSTLTGALLLTLEQATAALLMFAAAAVYVAGAFIVTIAVNVPLNNDLDATVASTTDETWTRYAGPWTAWNHVRALACFAAVVLAAVSVAVWGGAD